MVAGRLLEICIRILLARHWGPEEFGLLTLGLTVLTGVAVICFLGMQTTLTRYIAYYLARQEHESIRGVLITGLGIPLILALGASGLLYISASHVAGFFKEPEIRPVLEIFSIALPFFVFFRTALAALRGFGRILSFGLHSYISRQMLTLAGLLLVLALGARSTFPLPMIFLVSWVVMALAMTLVLTNRARPYLRTKGGSFHAKELLAFTWPLILAHYAHETRTWADLFFLEYFRGAADVGQFQAMATLARLLNLILVGFSFAGLPILTGLVSQQSFGEFKKSYAIVGSWMSYFACPVLAYFLFFGREAIGLFFGPMYQDQAMALAFLSCGFFVLVTAGMVGPAFNALKWNKKLLAIDLVGIAANVCLNFVLIPIYGIPGAAAATSMSLVLTTGLCLLFLNRGLGIRPPIAGKLAYLGVVLAVGLAMRFILGDTGLGLDPKLRAVAAPVLLSLASLAAILKLYGVNPDEKSILRSLKNRVAPIKRENGKS